MSGTNSERAALTAAARTRQHRRRVAGGIALAAATALVAVTVGEVAVGGRPVRATETRTPAPPLHSAPRTPAEPSPSSPLSSFSPAAVPSPTPRPSRPPVLRHSGSAGKGPLTGFRFPEESTWRTIPGDITVELTDDVRTDWNLNPCDPTVYPTDRERIAMRTLGEVGQEHFGGRQIVVYADEATAAEAMAGFRRVLAACSRTHRVWGWRPLDLGDEALVDWAASFQDGHQVPDGGYDVIVRDGRSVYMASDGAEWAPKGPTDMGATFLIDAAKHTLPLPQ